MAALGSGQGGGIVRRTLLASAAGLAGGLAMPNVLRAQSGPVKIGLVMAKQGPFADQGNSSATGARIALEQAGGKVLNRPVEIVWLDEPNPQGAQQNMLKAIQEEKVSAVIGGSNSATALGMSAVSKREQVPFIVHAAAAREITGAACHRYVFRDQGTIPTYSRLIAPLAAAMGKRWYFMVGAFAFGLDIYKSMQDELKTIGGTEVGVDQVPIGTSDFSAFILKIRQANPDVVVLGIAGADLVAFMNQFSEFGLKGKIQIAAVTIADNDIWSLDPKAVTGTYGKLWHYSDPRNSPEAAELDKSVTTRSGHPAGQNEYMGWIAMRMLLAGIDKGGATDASAIVRGLETARLSDGVYYREWDHQLMHRLVALKPKPQPTTKWDVVEVVESKPEKPADLESFHGTREQIGCKFES